MEKSRNKSKGIQGPIYSKKFSGQQASHKTRGNFSQTAQKLVYMQYLMNGGEVDDVFCSDPSTGLQFSVTQTSQQCSTTGWIMVTSPQSNCFYEKGLQKPSFFYSMTNTAVNWGSGNVLCRGILHVKGKAYRIQLSAVRFLKNETFF